MTKSRTIKRPSSRPLSRGLLDKLLRDLVGRIHHHIDIVEAIQTVNKPNGQHILVEHQLRTVFDVMLDRQLCGLRDIERLAQIATRGEGAAP